MGPLRSHLLVLLLLGALWGVPGCDVTGVHVAAGALSQAPRVWERFETVGFVWPEVENPFDPDRVAVQGEFEAPDGQRLAMPGFAFRSFRRALSGGTEHLTPRGQIYWKVRFTPTSPGTWRWRWRVTLPEADDETPWQSFEVAPAAPERHGFLRVSPLDPRYLRFDDGSPYFAVGENLAWYDGRGTFAYDDWFAKLAAQGVTYVRLWMPSWAFGLEWTERGPGGAVSASSLGDYTRRLDRAWQLDTVLEAAERHGIYVMLCLQNHGAFSLSANSEWNDNPYRAENGGPLARPSDFFIDPAARALFQRRLRYIVARWGYSTHVLSWELWNEVDLAEQPAGTAVLDWHAEMAGTLRALDPYQHLVSTSTAQPTSHPLWLLPALDLVQLHFYAWNDVFAFPVAPDFSTTPAFFLRRRPPGKPALFAELGTHSSGPAETLAADPQSIGIHDGLWGGLFAGAFGTAMTWWWDNVVDPENLYPHFGAVSSFVRGVAFDREGFAAGGASATAPGEVLRAQALRGQSVVLVWIKNVAHQWWPTDTGPHPEPVVGASLALDGLADAAWSAHWLDAYDGHEIAAAVVQVTGGTFSLDVPAFSRDVALRLERTDVLPTTGN
jgi:hypothetical protein